MAWLRRRTAAFRDGVWILDLNLVTFDESLDQLRAQAQRYDRMAIPW